MNAFDETLHRVLSRHLRRAIPSRTSSYLSSDPAITIGIATIKIVTEEQIQAIAFGALDENPEAIVRLDPIGRNVDDLLPFARFLDRMVGQAAATNSPLRVWTPHSVTLEALDVLGRRYWRNQRAPAEITRMGEICRIIAHEAMIPGQQLVADVAKLLQDHIITGLAPIEEGHLGALLAWFDPTITDPLNEARARIRVPASGVLPNTPDFPFDDRVDRLRKEAKAAHGTHRQVLEDRIINILQTAVRREWQLLVQGRTAFLGLNLPADGLDQLVTESDKRVREALDQGFFPARAPDRLAAQLGMMEAGQEKVDFAALDNDILLRDQAARAGDVVRGMVTTVRQDKAGFKPCDIEVESDQAVVRFRLDDKVRIVGTNVSGIVRNLTSPPAGGTRIYIEITNGVKRRNVLIVGARVELIHEPYAFVNHRALSAVRNQQQWIFYGSAAPAVPAIQSSGLSALAIARAARR